MVTKLRDNAQKYWRVLTALDTHAALRNGAIYGIAIILIALLFFGIESLIEEFIYNNDAVADLITAIASTFVFFWLRSALENARLAATLRERSEEHTAELERRVAEKTERIKQMYEGQSKFLVEIAHEFQTPIAILKGNILILSEPSVPANERRHTEQANAIYVATTTLDRLSRLVTNLLDIARLNFSKDKLRRQPVDIANLITTVRDDCAILAEDKNVSLMLVSKDPSAAIFVASDRDKLKEVLLNLLSNALKYTPAGGTISITADVHAEDQEAEIVVADTGSGIAVDKLPRIFERFYRIESAQHPAESGIGLGLHICRQIVEAHGGTIVAESQPGKGSRFIIHLPLVPAVV